MRLSNSYFYTIREKVKDEDSISGNLLVRSGMIKKTSSGIYMYGPMGLRVLRNIENIIREEMNNAGAQELLMPVLIPEDIYEKSGRLALFGNDVFKTIDRFDKKYILGPTHEELFAIAGAMKGKSYKDLPFNLYQFQTKFRDETRPRYGLIRVREFIMKDAYSFDLDLKGLDISYQKMFNAYKNSFDQMGLEYKIVTADTGVMGGILSEEFQAVTDVGEDILVLCEGCDYASNIEVSECVIDGISNDEPLKEKEELYTPNIGKVKDIVDRFGILPKNMVKSMLYKIDGELVLIMVNGEDGVNEVKLQKLFDAKEICLASEEEVRRVTSASIGFAGPVNIDVKIVADNKIKNMRNFLVGANKTDYHLNNVNVDCDFKVNQYADIRNIKEGDICPKCGKMIYFKKGIEVGNTFKLGTKYSEAFNLYYSDESNNLKPVVMGSYGIGLGRCIAAIVEQYNDSKGIVWPLRVAPYKVSIIVLNIKDEEQLNLANALYEELNKLNIDTILDDRNERAGVKFNDIDLIGIPIRITIGNKVKDNLVELKMRNSEAILEFNKDEIINEIKKIIDNANL